MPAMQHALDEALGTLPRRARPARRYRYELDPVRGMQAFEEAA